MTIQNLFKIWSCVSFFLFKVSVFHDFIPLNLKAFDPFFPVDGRETDNVLCLFSTSCTWLTIPSSLRSHIAPPWTTMCLILRFLIKWGCLAQCSGTAVRKRCVLLPATVCMHVLPPTCALFVPGNKNVLKRQDKAARVHSAVWLFEFPGMRQSLWITIAESHCIL